MQRFRGRAPARAVDAGSRSRRRRTLSMGGCTLCAIGVLALPATAAASNAKLIAQAKKQGASGQLAVKAHFKQTMPVTGRTLDVAKVADSSGRAYMVATDQ